jgi:hypothetical protein
MKTIKQHAGGGLIRIFSFFILALIAIQCSGPTGPEGPQGPRGYDGQNGADGTALAYSVLYDVYPEDWSGNVDGYRVYLDVPEITEDIYYTGAVLVYRLFEAEPKSFNLLPYTYVDNALSIYMDFDAYVGGIDMIYKEVYDGLNDTYAPASLMTFKVMIIEGIPLAKLKTMVDVNNFNAVAKLFDNSVEIKTIRTF